MAGGLQGYYLGFLQPKMFSITKSTEFTIMVIFGGIEHHRNRLWDAAPTALPEVLRAFAIWRLVVYGAAVIFIMISRPEDSWAARMSLAALRRLFGPRPKGGAVVSLLETKNLTKQFGGLTAVDNVTFTVEEGSITGSSVLTALARPPCLTSSPAYTR